MTARSDVDSLPSDGGTVRVLLVADPESADETAASLEREGERLSVETVPRVERGLERLDTDVDCIVSGYDVPGRNGVELLRAVRGECPDLPFILVADDGSETVASDAIRAGVTEYLPGDRDQPARLAERIEAAVEKYRIESEVATVGRRVRELSEVTNDILWMFTDDWSELLFVNSAYERIWGQPIERLEANSRDFLNGIHPGDRDRVREAMEALSDGESVDVEYRVNPDEEYRRWVWVQGEPIFDETGSVVRVAGFARDITRRKRREREFRRVRERMEYALEATEAVVWDWNVDDDRARFYPSEEELYGTTVETWDDFVDVVHPEDRQRLSEAIERALEIGEIRHEEIRIVRDGGVRWIEISGRRVEDDPARMIGVARDVTEHVEREREYKATSEQLSTLVSNAPVILFVLDSDGQFTVSQGQGLAKLGLEPGEVVGESVFDLYGDHESIVADAKRALDGETVRSVYAVGDRYFDTTWEPLEDGNADHLITVLGVARDVTERKEQRQELAAKNERLEEFVSVVSHDLRNPLNVARGQLELLREECEDERIDVVASAHDRMGALIDDLLTLARQRQSSLEPDVVEIDRILEECWVTVRTGDATLVAETDRTVEADPGRLRQLFENLFRNSIEHAGEDVTVRVGDLDGEAGFYVEDDGPGIDPDKRERVFESGYSTAPEGTGFGLAIVEAVADAHGWEVRVAESADGGARFEVVGVESTA